MLESLGFSPITFVVTIINIIILGLVLRAILFKPVTKFMAARTKKIRDSIDQAEKDKNQARATLEQYEGRLKKAENEAAEIIKTAREEAAVEAAKIVADGKAAAELLAANVHRQLDAERQAALAKFRVEAAVLVMAASAKLAERELNSDDNLRYVNMMLEELAARNIAVQEGNN